MVRTHWEPVERARAEGRPPRRYYELTGAGAEALREALERYPEVAGSLTPAGVLPQPRPA
jgi:DNA-binding PadR family transcriptional regulator